SPADGGLDVHSAEDDAGHGRPAPSQDDAVHAGAVHLHVPQPAIRPGALLDALERAADRAAEVHRARVQEARGRQAGEGTARSEEGVRRRSDRDTIVGIATPPGTGAIGVIRVSGPGAIPAASQLIDLDNPDGLGACQPRTLHVAMLVDPRSGAEMDKAMVV